MYARPLYPHNTSLNPELFYFERDHERLEWLPSDEQGSDTAARTPVESPRIMKGLMEKLARQEQLSEALSRQQLDDIPLESGL